MPKPLGILAVRPIAIVTVKFDPRKPGAKAAAAATSAAIAKKALSSPKKH